MKRSGEESRSVESLPKRAVASIESACYKYERNKKQCVLPADYRERKKRLVGGAHGAVCVGRRVEWQRFI